MKKIITLIAGIILTTNLLAQDTLAGWTFSSGTAIDAFTNLGNIANAAMIVSTVGGTGAIDFSKNGVTTKSAQATGWDSGANTKFWQITISTTGYENITLSSKITSGGNNPGPRDFKVQYMLPAGTWIDVPGSEFITANDWTTGVITDLPLPTAIKNQSLVYVRWLVTSDTSTSGSLIASNGISKIDDILVKGTSITSGIHEGMANNIPVLYPNPSKGIVNISLDGDHFVKVFNATGQLVESTVVNGFEKLDLRNMQRGFYFIQTTNLDNAKTESYKLILN